MAEVVTIARPYAEAAFRLAQEQQQLPAWSEMLDLLARVVADPQVAEIIGHPQHTAAQMERLLLSICGDRLSPEGQRFVQVLIHNDRLPVLPAIRELYEELKARHEGVLEAHIATALPMNDAQVQDLVARLEARFQRKVEPKVTVDPELIGGVKVEIGDQVLDASVRAKLGAMAAALIR